MEQKPTPEVPELGTTEQSAASPRPAWQIWGARIALIVFAALIIMYYLNIARGGL